VKPHELARLPAEKCQAYNESTAPKLYASLDSFKKKIDELGGRRRKKKPQLELRAQ
jgi:hypothetical protein